MRTFLNWLNKYFLILSLVFLPNIGYTCTWFAFDDSNANWFIGRTMEWPTDLLTKITIVPRNYKLGKVNTEYGFVGMSHNGLFTDGLNEYGLAASALWLDVSKYSDTKVAKYAITDLLPYVLGNTKSVDEAAKFIQSNKFYTFKSALTNNIALKLHFAITDQTGASIVVEFLNGKTYIYDNKIKVLTNEPTYEEQINYAAHTKMLNIKEENFAAFDYSPTGRFLKMVAFNMTKPTNLLINSIDSINRAWSMVNSVDIPKGSLYLRYVNDDPEFTSYSIVADLNERIYFFRSYDNYNIRKIDLKKINFSTMKYQSNSIFGNPNYQEYKFRSK